MKKKLLFSLLLAGTLIQANDYKYEISPMLGYNTAEGNLGIKDDGYFTGGLELQFNTLGSKISPEFSLFHSRGIDYKAGGDTQITRGAFNGVYTFEPTNSIIPFAKLGAGIENISDEIASNQTGMFLDAGAGLKVPFKQNWALKLEAIYLAKIGSAHNEHTDNNLMTLVGLTYSFGAQKAQIAPKLDSDNDGVLDELDKCPNTPAGTKVDSKGCKLFLDDDKDGVENSLDKCPNTEAGTKVDSKGCKLFLDDDKDGVENSLDKCPNTEAGTKVDSNGCKILEKVVELKAPACPPKINLHINFKFNSYEVDQASQKRVEKFADFLKCTPDYKAKIVGYTDSIGTEAYNQKLSEERANTVKNMLIKDGVAVNRVTSAGMSETHPIATNKTKEGRAQNRRIEAELTKN